jgi:hypothetical protein
VENLMGHGNAILLASKNDLKPMILLLMVCFETLNPTAKACTFINQMTLKKKVTCLRLEHLLRGLFKHLSQNNHFCS